MAFLGTQISFMNLVYWLAFGLIAGFIAQLLSFNTVKGGMKGSLVLGALGAVSGGALATFIYGIGMSGFDLTALAVALTGAIAFLGVYRLTMHDSSKYV